MQKRNLIVDYRLNVLDAMELLIALLKKEIAVIKIKQAFKEHEEKLKVDVESKKTRKTTKNVRKK